MPSEIGRLLADGAFGPLHSGRLGLVTDLASVAPVTTDQLAHLLGPGVVTELDALLRSPMAMVAQVGGRWHVAPLLRDVLLARDPERWAARMSRNFSLAQASAEAGDLMDGLARMKSLDSRGGLARYVGQWSVREALRGFPEVALELLREFEPDELSRNPDLLLARAMTDVVLTDLPATAHWLDLLEHHHDPGSPPWTSTHPLTTAALRETAGIIPVGEGTKAAMNAGLPWAALAHIMAATDAICRGELDRAEGVLTVLRSFSPSFPLIGGWRVALLSHVYRHTDREADAVRLYRRVFPNLEASAFAGQRITFFLDSAMGRSAALAGDREIAERLMSRSLDKTAEIRAGGFTTRLLVYLNNAGTAEWLGNRAVELSALEAADRLVALAPDAPALAPLVHEHLTRARRGGQGPSLSPTQLRVLTHLSGPYTVPEIAKAMFVSRATVRTHVRRLYAALGVSGRGAAVDRARKLGLIP